MAKSSSGGTSGSASSKGAGGTQGSKSSSGKDWSSGPSTSQSKTGFSVSGQTGGGNDGWGWDRNNDGKVSLAEKALDMIDGGGKGKTGPTFEGGIFSGALNAAGVSPYGQGSGAVSNVVDRVLGTMPTIAPPYANLPRYVRKLLIDVLPHMTPDMKDEVRPILEGMGIPSTPPEGPPTGTPPGETVNQAPLFSSLDLDLSTPDMLYEDYLARVAQAQLPYSMQYEPISGPSPFIRPQGGQVSGAPVFGGQPLYLQQGIGSLPPTQIG